MMNRSSCRVSLVVLFGLFAVTGVSSRALAMGSRKNDGGTSPASAQSDVKNDTVWVSRKDGGTSCGVKEGQSLEQGANELQRAGVRILNSRKASDGKMYAQMCGMPTGSLNAYEIARTDLGKALTLNFQETAQSSKK